MIRSDPFLSDVEFRFSNKFPEVFDSKAIRVEDAEFLCGGKGDRFTEKVQALFAGEGEVGLDAFESGVRFSGDEGEIEGAVAGSDVEFRERTKEPVAGCCVVVLGEDFFQGGIVIFGRGEIRADEQPVLGADGVSEGTKDLRRPEIVNRAEEKDDPFCPGGVEVFQERGENGTGADFTNERSALQTAQCFGGGLLRAEDHFKTDIGRGIDHGAAGFANHLEAASVFGAVATSDADDMDNVAAAKFGSTTKG